MNLTSCRVCGVVLDKDKLMFPDPWNEEKEEYDMSKCEYDDGEFISVVPCPVCESTILENQ